jgi:hypothetical protein
MSDDTHSLNSRRSAGAIGLEITSTHAKVMRPSGDFGQRAWHFVRRSFQDID